MFLYLAVSLSVTEIVLADQNFCLIETESEYGNTRTCIENINLPHEYFKHLCELPSDESIRVKSEYLVGGCPMPYRGVCKDLKMQNGAPLPYISYIYENSMDLMISSCEKGGGTWFKGGK